MTDRECAYCKGGDDAYDHLPDERAERMSEWYQRDDGEWAHRGCSPRA